MEKRQEIWREKSDKKQIQKRKEKGKKRVKTDERGSQQGGRAYYFPQEREGGRGEI